MNFKLPKRWLRATAIGAALWLSATTGWASADAPLLPVSVEGLPGLTASTRSLAPQEYPTARPLSKGRHSEILLHVPEALLGEEVWVRVQPDFVGFAYMAGSDGQVQRSGIRLTEAERSQTGAPGLGKFRLSQTSYAVRISLQSAAPQLLNVRVLSDSALQRELAIETMTSGLFFGAGLLIFLLTLASWLGSGDPLFRDFALYILSALTGSIFLNSMAGPHWFTLDARFHVTAGLATFALFSVMSILFTLRLLDLRQQHPLATRVLYVVCAGMLGTALTGVLLDDPPLVAPYLWGPHLVVELALLGYALYLAWYERRTRSVLIALALFLYSTFEKAPLLAIVGLLPVSVRSHNLPMLGFASQMLLIHFLLLHQLRQQQQLAQRTAMAQLDAAKERAHREDLLKFLAMFGHEVRTPLAVIDSSTQSLELLPGADQPAQRQRHQRIRQAVARLQALASEALARERLEAKGWQALPRPITVRELLEATLPRHGIELPALPSGQPVKMHLRDTESAAQLLLDCIDPDTVVHVDPTMIGLALDNLLDNARKYGTPGLPVELDILSGVSPTQGSTLLRFAVLSQGKPLQKTEVERVFEKYWRSREHRTVGGAGLGLYLVKLVAEAHGGQVEARALPGNVNSFSFEFPLLPPHS